MKLSDLKKDYEELSGLASELNRKLIFSGIAIIWIFHYNIDLNEIQKVGIVPEELNLPLRYFCFSFALDLLQYFLLSVIWYSYYWNHRITDRNDEDITVNQSELWNLIPWLIWIAKIACTFIAYYYLASFLRINL